MTLKSFLIICEQKFKLLDWIELYQWSHKNKVIQNNF